MQLQTALGSRPESWSSAGVCKKFHVWIRFNEKKIVVKRLIVVLLIFSGEFY
jgi:hypothetical protein